MAEEPALVQYDAMVAAIELCAAVDEIKEIRAKAIALEAYAKVAMNLENESKCAKIRIRAERRCGALLREMAEKGERAGKREAAAASRGERPAKPTLADHGITKDQSSDWQKLASIPEKRFEEELGKSMFPSTGQVLQNVYPQKREPSPIANVDPAAMELWGRLADLKRYGVLKRDPNELLATMTISMREDVLRWAPIVISFLSRLDGGTNGVRDSETELADPGALQPTGRAEDARDLSR